MFQTADTPNQSAETANTNQVVRPGVPASDAAAAAAANQAGPVNLDTSLARTPSPADGPTAIPPGVTVTQAAPSPDPASAAAAGANAGASAAGAGVVGGASAGGADLAVGNVPLSLEQRIENLEAAQSEGRNAGTSSISDAAFDTLVQRVSALEAGQSHPEADSDKLTARVQSLFKRIFGEE